jgi:hypothetical protein
MGLGTKNRQKQIAEICKQRLRRACSVERHQVAAGKEILVGDWVRSYSGQDDGVGPMKFMSRLWANATEGQNQFPFS